MRLEDGHPDVSPEHMKSFIAWQKVCRSLSLIDEVIDRSECRMPNWFVPLARGAAIASPALLRWQEVERRYSPRSVRAVAGSADWSPPALWVLEAGQLALRSQSQYVRSWDTLAFASRRRSSNRHAVARELLQEATRSITLHPLIAARFISRVLGPHVCG
jgi:hypothetical protein